MSDLKAFRIEGTFPMGIERKQRFTRELASKDENEARERLYSLLGSEHGVKRRWIKIKSIKQIKEEEITSHNVKQKLGVK